MKQSPTNRVVTSSLVHWNYFLALEDEVINLSRYIEFSKENYNTYSIELAKILMAATQECDVLLRQICSVAPGNERTYYTSMISSHPGICSQIIAIPRYGLEFTPFDSWATTTTPKWWTANNKVKHERHLKFGEASLEYMLNAVSALLLCNLYFYKKEKRLIEIQPMPRLFEAVGLMSFVELTPVGIAPVYELP